MANENMNIIRAGQDTARPVPKINTITCGDCIEVMQLVPDKSVDMILCDLPYGTTQNKWDTVIPFVPLWKQYNRICLGAIVLTASQPFTSAIIMSNLKMFKHEWIWIKNRGSNFANTVREPMKEHESVLVFAYGKWTYNKQMQERTGGGLSRVGYKFTCCTETENYGRIGNPKEAQGELRVPSSWQKFNTEVGLHPTQKPVALFEYLIRTYTNEGDTVLDNCIGSGTTAIACINTGRNYIGIEKEERYCRIAEERIHALRSPVQNTKEICHTAPNSGRDAMLLTLWNENK
jgi:site-specific DNA-methyltransferase (adenine-specific)